MCQNKRLDVGKRLGFQMEFLKGPGADTPAHLWHPLKAPKLGPSLVQAPWTKEETRKETKAWQCFI